MSFRVRGTHHGLIVSGGHLEGCELGSVECHRRAAVCRWTGRIKSPERTLRYISQSKSILDQPGEFLLVCSEFTFKFELFDSETGLRQDSASRRSREEPGRHRSIARGSCRCLYALCPHIGAPHATSLAVGDDLTPSSMPFDASRMHPSSIAPRSSSLHAHNVLSQCANIAQTLNGHSCRSRPNLAFKCDPYILLISII